MRRGPVPHATNRWRGPRARASPGVTSALKSSPGGSGRYSSHIAAARAATGESGWRPLGRRKTKVRAVR